MSTFVYEAVEPGGRTVRGKLEAENQQSVLSQLQELRYHVVSVDERRGSGLTFLEREQEITGRIKGAMVYPTCVLVFAVLMVVAIFLFVLPTFKEIFADFHSTLPVITQLMFGISTFMRDFWYIIGAFPFGVFF